MITNILDHLKNSKHVLSFQRFFYSFFLSLAGVCKYVGALLYHISSEVREGNNKTYTSKPQAQGRPSALAKERYSASRLSNIQIKKDRVHRGNSLVPWQTCTVTRSGYDPRAVDDRQPMALDQDDLIYLAALTNGRCGILLNSDYPQSQSEPDINDIAGEETVQAIDKPLPISDQTAMIHTQWLNSSVEVKIRNFFRQHSSGRQYWQSSEFVRRPTVCPLVLVFHSDLSETGHHRNQYMSMYRSRKPISEAVSSFCEIS